MSKKEKIKRKGFLSYINPKNLALEVHRYGYNFSITKYLRNLILAYAGIIFLAYFYKLKTIPILIIVILATIFLPSVFHNAYRNMYEHKKFDDLTNYMEQMLYSFKRRSKILTSLQDTLTTFKEGEMHDAIVKAIEYIQESNTSNDVYREALAFIEETYGCRRLRTMHDFLIKIETSGGEYDDSVKILLDDRKLWVDRTYSLQLDKKNIKIKIAIGVLISFIVGLVAVYVIPEQLDVVSKFASQAVTTFVFICNMAVWYIANRALSGSLIQTGNEYSEAELKKKYNLVFHDKKVKQHKLYKAIGIILIPFSIFGFVKFGVGVGIILVCFAYLLFTQPNRMYNSAFKRIRTEVEKAFPDWLLSMSLRLQTDNVHVAMSKSITDAPAILQEELHKLQDNIEKYPNSIEPYNEFMSILNISDVHSAMVMLFSLSEFGAKNISEQINALVERNSIMTDRAERLRAEDFLAGMGFFVLAPMITGVLKLVVDMALIIFTMLQVVTF